MQCPACHYQMTPFDATCPRCAQHGPPKVVRQPQSPTAPPAAAPPPAAPPPAWGAPPPQAPPPPGWQAPPGGPQGGLQSAPGFKVLDADEDQPSFAFALAGFLVPIAGFILWLINKDKTPQKAYSALRGAGYSMALSILAFGVLFSLALRNPGYDPDVSGQNTPFELMIRDEYNNRLAEKGAAFTCTSVDLVKDSYHHYIGVATLSDNDVMKMKVTVSDDRTYIWEATPP